MKLRYPFEAHRQAGIPVAGESWRDENYTDEDLAGVVFHECELVNLRMRRVDFSMCIFNACRLENCAFVDCTLSQTQFAACTGSSFAIVGGVLNATTFSESKLDRLEIAQAGDSLAIAECDIGHLCFRDGGVEQQRISISGGGFGRLEAPDARWQDGMANELDLSVCEFGNGRFERTSFVKARAAGLDLSRLDFLSCNLYQSDFTGARLRRAESAIFAECDLADADLRRASLGGALFAKARAEGARFDGANLNGAMFPEAALARASFENASAVSSIWSETDLTEANLAGMDASSGALRHARLSGANVDDASFVSAQLHGIEEEDLIGANTLGAQRTVEWRAEREREALKPPKTR